MASLAAGHWADWTFTAERLQQQATWHQVSAQLLEDAPADPTSYDSSGGNSWAAARWTVPGRQARVGVIWVTAGAKAGSRVRIWVDASGASTGAPLSRSLVRVRVALAVAAALAVVATALLCLAALARWLLHRRRLAAWDTEWASVGP